MKCQKCGAPVAYRENHSIGLDPKYRPPEPTKGKPTTGYSQERHLTFAQQPKEGQDE